MKKWIACIGIGLLGQVYGQQTGTVFIQSIPPRLIEQRIEYSRVNAHNFGCRRYDLVILPKSILRLPRMMMGLRKSNAERTMIILEGVPVKFASGTDYKRKSVFSWSGNARMTIISSMGGGYIVIDP